MTPNDFEILSSVAFGVMCLGLGAKLLRGWLVRRSWHTLGILAVVLMAGADQIVSQAYLMGIFSSGIELVAAATLAVVLWCSRKQFLVLVGERDLLSPEQRTDLLKRQSRKNVEEAGKLKQALAAHEKLSEK